MTKENIEKAIDTRFNEIVAEYKRLKVFIATRKVKLYKFENDIQEELQEDDVKWIEFCNGFFKENSIANRIFKESLERNTWIQEISLIWMGNDFSKEKMEEIVFKAQSIFPQIDGQRQSAVVHSNKRWKKAKVYIFK